MKIRICPMALALVACLLALSLSAVGLASPAGDSAEIPEALGESDIVGLWQLTTLIVDGTTLSADMLGIDMRYEFRADHAALGSYVGNLGDSGSAEETWTLDEERALVCVGGSPLLKVRSEDGVIFLMMDEEISPDAGGTLVFTRCQQP